MPKKGADDKKTREIISLLEDNPQGMWAREIARKTGISKSTVSRYLNSYLAEQVEEEWMGRNRIFRKKKEEEAQEK